MARPTKKYRPYLSLDDMKEIISKLPPESRVAKYLDSFIYDIEKGWRKADHTTSPRTTLEEKLGIDTPSKGSMVTKEEIEAEEKRVAELFGRD